MTDSVAQEQLRAFVERILRMKEEAKAINDDIREIYAEAKGNGFDKTVLGKLVSYVEKRAKSADTLAEQDALFDLYLKAYDGHVYDEEDERPSRTHAHAREAEPDHDAETGEIIEPNPAPAASNSQAERQPESTEVDTSAGANAEVATPPAASAPIQPETAAQTVTAHEPVAASSTEHEAVESSEPYPVANVGEEANGAIAAASVDPASRGVDDADRQQLVASGFTGDAGEGGQHPRHEPSSAPSPTGSAAGQPGEAGGVSPSASPAPTKLKMNAEFFDEPHVLCQRPGFCGGNSAIALCDNCRAAAGIDGHVHDADERVLN